MNLSIYLPENIIESAKTAASKDHRSLSQYIRLLLIEKLQETQNEPKIN